MKAFSFTGLWKHGDFLRLWVSETVGAFGRQVTGLALPTVAILLLGAGPFEMGILGSLQMLAFPILGLAVGVWVDRWRRRPIMVIANLGRMIALGSIPLAFMFGILGLYQLYLVAAVVGVFTVFFDVAYQSYLPALIDRADLVEGNAKLETSQSAAQVGGPALAGFLIQMVGGARAIAADAAAFLVSALFLWSIKKEEPSPSSSSSDTDPSFLLELKEGAQVVFKNPTLTRIAGCTATSNFGASMSFTVFLIFVYDQLLLSAEVIGIVFGLASIALLIGAILASRVAKAIGLGRALALSTLLFGISTLGLPFALFGSPILVLVVFHMIGNFGLPIYNINQVSLRQAITPDRLQGRMNATMRTIVWGTIPVGSFIGGTLGAQIGIVWTIVVGGAMTAMAVVWIIFGPVISMKKSPEPF